MSRATSDISSDESSDDEFLTVADGDGGKNVDREALVRKKLIESFYGASAVAAAAPAVLGDTDDDEDEDDDDDDVKLTSSGKKTAGKGDLEDLDSPLFDAAAHTQKYVVEASVHTLLEKEEQLALQVRTLDSTMQTLVYENYTRFIDATDAIRSIGVNVQANEGGLERLTAGMQAIDEKSRAVEDALGSLRDQVAEKIRVKRLLTRLDALLKLPRTLKEQIAAGKFRTATKSYLQAASILGKHSEGFESLKTIETECTTILSDMKTELNHKLLHWSGRVTTFNDSIHGGSAGETETVPDPPKKMTEIFECVSTLLILLQSGQLSVSGDEQGEETSVEDLQSMASAAALRLLDRILDSHLIEVQELRFATPSLDSTALDLKLGGVQVPGMEPMDIGPPGSALVANEFLNAMLEGATLFAMTFDAAHTAKDELMELVSEAFSSFLVHTKSVLLEESAHLGKDDAVGGGHDVDEAESGYSEISGALALLVQSVREVASGLSLPEVGVSPDYSSKLVEQVTDLMESMVRRRVDQKFHALRLSVVEDCLVPFARHAAAEEESSSTLNDEKDVLAFIRQNVSITLSNCLQLVDDTIRSILAGDLASGDHGPSAADVPDLKDAVYASTKKFAFWLANTFELLAGGESSDRNRIVDAFPGELEDKEEGPSKLEGRDVTASQSVAEDDVSDMPGQDETLLEKLDLALASIAPGEGGYGTNTVRTDFVLAVAEMCRMAQCSVSVNLEQSIATHIGGSKKKSRGLFPSGESTPIKKSGPQDDISARFQLAESRVLVLYAGFRGSEAANLLCLNLSQLSATPDGPVLERPTDLTLQALAIAKITSIEFASVYGGSRRARIVTEVDSGRMPGVTVALTSRKTGLQLDVERMFKEKVEIYPHPSESLEVSRSAAVFLLFKMAFRAMFEQARLLQFSPSAYRQLQIDKEFLKLMTTHYIGDGFNPGGTSALTALSNLLEDIVDVVGDRCLDDSITNSKDALTNSALQHVHSFLKSDSDLKKLFVIEED